MSKLMVVTFVGVSLNVFAYSDLLAISCSQSIVEMEPLYITISNTGGFPSDRFGPLEARTMPHLILNAGEKRKRYSPPIKFDPARPGNSSKATKSHSTVILNSDGSIISRDKGELSIWLEMKDGNRVSNKLAIVVHPGTAEERQLIDRAKANAQEYAQFIYFGGGDQFAIGKEIVSDMASSTIRFRRWARAIIATNYAQDYFAYSGIGVPREKSFPKVLEFFPESDSPENLKLELLSLLSRSNKGELGSELFEKLQSMAEFHKASRSQMIEKLVNEKSALLRRKR